MWQGREDLHRKTREAWETLLPPLALTFTVLGGIQPQQNMNLSSFVASRRTVLRRGYDEGYNIGDRTDLQLNVLIYPE